MTGLLLIAGAAVVGALVGLAADWISTRWPSKEADYQRRWPDWRTIVVPLAGAIVAAGLVTRWTDPRDLAILGVYFAALLVLLATDLDQRILPDLVTVPLIVFAAALLVLGVSPLLAGKSLALVSAVGAALGLPILLFVSDRIIGGQLGGGDLKLAVSLGLMSGATRLFYGLLVASIGFAVVLLALMALRRLTLKTAVPFGPVLIAAAFVAALSG